MAGKLWMFGGVLLLANVFIGNMTIMVAIIMILAFVPMIYSYIIYNNSKKNR
jgi:type IV secretory pathway TrbL component